MNTPLVSVVLATYEKDDPRQLAEAVDSVIAQTHRPLELLVTCDGPISPAGEEVLAVRRAEHPWISLHRREDRGGPGAARNAVLNSCRGDYVAILDADDAMEPHRIERQVAYLTEHELDVVGSWLQVVEQDGTELEVRRFPVEPELVQRRSAFFCPTANPAILFRSSLLPGYHYPEHLPVGEDYRLWVHLMRTGRRIGNLPEPLTRYRVGSGYYQRRTGMNYARGDRNTKLIAMSLVPWWQRPLVLAGAEVTYLVRLLPPGIFRIAYRMFEGVTRGGDR